MSNLYVTVRLNYGKFYVNVIRYDGTIQTYGQHGYIHRRSARRAAIASAKRIDVSYRQDLEYIDTPHAFVAEVATSS